MQDLFPWGGGGGRGDQIKEHGVHPPPPQQICERAILHDHIYYYIKTHKSKVRNLNDHSNQLRNLNYAVHTRETEFAVYSIPEREKMSGYPANQTFTLLAFPVLNIGGSG